MEKHTHTVETEDKKIETAVTEGSPRESLGTTLSFVSKTQEAATALLPSTTHPQSWAEPHIHVHTGKSLPSVFLPHLRNITYHSP